jgi:class 3 adenylate cyclase/PAS domain-containing protein
LIEESLVPYESGEPESYERTLPGGRTLQFYSAPTPEGGFVSIITDITERKRAEEELAEKEAQLRIALDNMPGALVYTDEDLNIVLCNERFSEMQQVSRELLQPGQPYADFLRYGAEHGYYGEGDAEALFAERVESLRNPSGKTFEDLTPDGRVYHIRRQHVAAGGTVTVATDITDLKRAERELAEKEAQLRVALDNMPGGMILVDGDRKYVLFNPQYSELHDYPDGLLKVGESILDEARFQAERGDYGPGDPDKLIEESMVPYESGESESYERTLLDGRTLQFYSAPTPEGGYVSIITDITERKRAEQELAEKEAQLRLALDNMPGGMMMWDRDLNYVLFNAQYSELCDFPDGLLEVGGSIRDELRYQAERGDFGPGDKDDLIEEVVAIYQRGEAVSDERAIAGSGRTVQIYDGPTPEGGYVSIITDISARKRAEEALLEAKERTEEASKLVAEKNRMLESLSNQLSKYLSPQVYASIFAGEQSVEIASKRKKLTVFFSDIADFTGTTDSLESEELTNLLNHYLTEMSKIAVDHGATIDKYVGDAIIAFFGDPETRGVKEDARACVNMAIAMQRRMRELHSEWLDMGLERPFQLRIGINTGFCTVGNFGSEDRMDYTIIGNQVNLAARLESLAEVGGILMAHETHALVKDMVLAEEGDTLTVKGFAKPVRTYSVVGLYDDLAEQGRIIRKDEDGLRVLVDLSKQDRAGAIQAIEDVLSQLKG